MPIYVHRYDVIIEPAPPRPEDIHWYPSQLTFNTGNFIVTQVAHYTLDHCAAGSVR